MLFITHVACGGSRELRFPASTFLLHSQKSEWAVEFARRYFLTGCHVWPVGVPETNFNDRAFSMLVAAPSRTVSVYALMPEKLQEMPAS